MAYMHPDTLAHASRANRLLQILKVSKDDITINDALETLEALYILKYGGEKPINDEDD